MSKLALFAVTAIAEILGCYLEFRWRCSRGWLVEKQTPDRWDDIGAGVALLGMATSSFGPR